MILPETACRRSSWVGICATRKHRAALATLRIRARNQRVAELDCCRAGPFRKGAPGVVDEYSPDRFPSSLVVVGHSQSLLNLNSATALIVILTQSLQRLLRPVRSRPGLTAAAAGDLTRTRPELIAENALLRQQVIVLPRSIEISTLTTRGDLISLL